MRCLKFIIDEMDRHIELLSYIDILNTLEKYGFLESADRWSRIRKLRNEFVYLYPWETEHKLEVVNEALREISYIKETYAGIREYILEKDISGDKTS